MKPHCEFDTILLSLDLLQYEINAGIKSSMNLNWSVFMREICKELQFNRENDLNYIEKRFYHYKLWEDLEICYIALSDELLTPYVHQCLLENKECFAEGYWEYANHAINDTSIYGPQMAFIFLHSLMLFRQGIRSNCSQSICLPKVS